jgi:hypothetical protein
MLGSLKQVKWAISIRNQKLEEIEEYFPRLGWFDSEKLPIIKVLLNAQEDATWWIDNRHISLYGLLLWAASQANLQLPGREDIVERSGVIYPFSTGSELDIPLSESISLEISKEIPNNPINPCLKPLNPWIAVVDNEQLNLDWYVIERNNVRNSEQPSFSLSCNEPSRTSSLSYQPLYRLFQKKDGGWSSKGWEFIIIYHYPDGRFYIEAIIGELIVRSSFLRNFFTEVQL